jgi:flagellar hook assembly protein FlgD
MPEEFTLLGNYPNPFNPTTSIRFLLPEAKQVSLVIYNTQGRVVQTILNNVELGIGEHQFSWNAEDANGSKVASGMYIYRLTAGKANKLGKMILLK